MRVVFEQWKYILKNLWFVLPFGIVPAFFLALCVDFNAIRIVATSLFGGSLDLTFTQIFRAWSIINIGTPLGIISSVLGAIVIVFGSSLLLSFVEKHMRIGKRTLSGVFSQIGNHITAFIIFTLTLLFIFEVWAIALSAVLTAICTIPSKVVARIFFVLISLVFVAALIYLITVIYLWLPCKLHTGFRTYDALLYSYRLVIGVRWRLILSLVISYVPCFFILFASSFGPEILSRILSVVLFTFAYLSFCVRMETLYFETDKLDREDLLRSYREL